MTDVYLSAVFYSYPNAKCGKILNNAHKTSQKGKMVHSAVEKKRQHNLLLSHFIFCYCRRKLSKAFFREWCACLSFTLSLVQSELRINLFVFLHPRISTERPSVHAVHETRSLERRREDSQLQRFVLKYTHFTFHMKQRTSIRF